MGAGLGEGLREKLPHPRLPLTLAGEAPEPVSLCSFLPRKERRGRCPCARRRGAKPGLGVPVVVSGS